MEKETWFTREVPILEWLVEHFDANPGTWVKVGVIMGGVEMPYKVVQAALIALGDGADPYVRGSGTSHVGFLFITGVTEKARRAVGTWPSEKSAADSLIAALEEAIACISDPEERTKMQRLLEAAKSVGTSVLGGVLTAAGTGVLGV